MKTYTFTATATIEAENEQEARNKFADNSFDFAASAEVIEKCAECGENMYSLIRAHHHTENGKDVTK